MDYERDTTIQEGQTDTQQPPNPRILDGGADHMVPLDQVQRLIAEAMTRERERMTLDALQVAAAVQRVTGGEPGRKLVDTTLIGLSKDLPSNGTITNRDISTLLTRFKHAIQGTACKGKSVRANLLTCLAASPTHLSRFKDLMMKQGFSVKLDEVDNIGDDITFGDMFRLIEQFEEQLRPSSKEASSKFASLKFDPSGQTGEQFVIDYRKALADIKPKGAKLEDWESYYALHLHALLLNGALDSSASTAVHDLDSARKRLEGNMTMGAVVELALETFPMLAAKQSTTKLFHMRTGPFQGACYNCGERGHRSIDCTKKRSSRRPRYDSSDDDKSVVSEAGSSTAEQRKKSLAKKFNPGSSKTADSKKARRLLVLRFSGKLILVDTGAECSVWFTNKIDWKTKLFSLTTVDTLGGLVPARQLLEPFDVIPGLWMSKIMVVEDNPIIIDGEVIEVIMGIDAMWLAGGFNLWLEKRRGVEKAYIQFRFSPEVYSISEETIQASHGEKFLHFQVLNTIQSGTEKLKIPQFDLEDVHACPPGSKVVEVIECKDFRLFVVKPQNDSKLRLVVRYKTKANQGIKARFGKGHYFDRLSEGDLQLVLAKIKEWISEGRCVPVEHQYVKSIIPVFCVLQGRSSTLLIISTWTY